MSGCTIGAKRIGPRYFLFKNKDLVYENFVDNLIFDNQIIALTGIDTATDEPVGVSFGVNRWGLACCSSTVLINEAHSYDILLEKILRECEDIECADNLIQQELDPTHYQLCNIVLVSPAGVGVIEIGESDFATEKSKDKLLRTNHHLLLDTTETVRGASAEQREAAGSLASSQRRRQTAAKILESAVTMSDFVSLVSTHSSSKGFDSICRHWSANPRTEPFRGATLYSYILEFMQLEETEYEMRMHIAKGNPCSNAFKTFEIDFDAPAELKQELVRNYS